MDPLDTHTGNRRHLCNESLKFLVARGGSRRIWSSPACSLVLGLALEFVVGSLQMATPPHGAQVPGSGKILDCTRSPFVHWYTQCLSSARSPSEVTCWQVTSRFEALLMLRGGGDTGEEGNRYPPPPPPPPMVWCLHMKQSEQDCLPNVSATEPCSSYC